MYYYPIVHVQRTSEEKKYGNNIIINLWRWITNLIAEFKNKDIIYQYRILTRIFIAFTIIMIIVEILCLFSENLWMGLIPFAIYLSVVYVPVQLIVGLFNSIHIYHYIYDDSALEKVTKNTCLCINGEIDSKKKYRFLRTYISKEFKEPQIPEVQKFIYHLVLKIKENRASLSTQKITRICWIYKYNNDEYNLVKE